MSTKDKTKEQLQKELSEKLRERDAIERALIEKKHKK